MSVVEPYLELLSDWMYHGVAEPCSPDRGVLMVVATEGANGDAHDDGSPWEGSGRGGASDGRRYVLRDRREVPAFLRPLGRVVVEAGRSARILRSVDADAAAAMLNRPTLPDLFRAAVADTMAGRDGEPGGFTGGDQAFSLADLDALDGPSRATSAADANPAQLPPPPPAQTMAVWVPHSAAVPAGADTLWSSNAYLTGTGGKGGGRRRVEGGG